MSAPLQPTDRTRDASRRAYWTAQMDEADAFMGRILHAPVAECDEPVASMPEAVDSAGVEVAFSDQLHASGHPRQFLLREGLLACFLDAARAMNDRGWILKVEDGYRTVEMQRGLGLHERVFQTVLDKVCWECGGSRPSIALLLKRLGGMVAQYPKVGTHMSGSAIDVTVLDRDSGMEVDRGGPYLTISEATPMDSPYVSGAARANRRQITALMARHGFTAYPWEFWHYNAGDAYAAELNRTGQPARYGAVHVDPATGRVRTVAEPDRRLVSEAEILVRLQHALAGCPSWSPAALEGVNP